MVTRTILDEIVAHKRQETALSKAARPLAAIQRVAEHADQARDFVTALTAPGISLIAEVKRASPSRGAMRLDLDPASQAVTYAANGAATISVLTDARFFGGSLEDLRLVRSVVPIPVLRKDFMLEPYQVYEARAYGADAILLIVAALADQTLSDLLALACELGMAALVEVHSGEELSRALASGARLIGINNRNLHTFEVDLAMTERLRPGIPDGVVVVAESGVHTVDDVARLRVVGVDAMLVGTALVTAQDTAAMVRSLAAGA
jgi:indole-3-glycerol phosphate synthase